MILDDREYVSYPDLDEDKDGNLYIIYDRERDNRVKRDENTWVSKAAKEILVCKITLHDVMHHTLGAHSFVRKVISKAKIDRIEV